MELSTGADYPFSMRRYDEYRCPAVFVFNRSETTNLGPGFIEYINAAFTGTTRRDKSRKSTASRQTRLLRWLRRASHLLVLDSFRFCAATRL
jgi:hypothetical protein